MTVIERLVDCVIDIAFVDIVFMECIGDFGEFIQFLRKIFAKVRKLRHEVHTPVDGRVEQLRGDLLISHQ